MRVINRTLLALIFTAGMLCAVSAQNKPAPAKKLPAPAAAAAQTGDGDTENPAEQGWAGATSGKSFTLGGGYFMPQSEMASIFKPSWSIKLSARNNNVANTLFGIGGDIIYTTVKDKEISDGRMTYVTVLPHVTAAFTFFDVFDIAAKGGAGISSITSKVNGKSNGSVSLTLGFGGGIARVFNGKFITGLDVDYLYYMQRTSSKSLSAYLYMGYRM
jgi:hypothetical protein